MTEGNVYTLYTIAGGGGEVNPHPADGGYPILPVGVLPSFPEGGGVPPSFLLGVTPILPNGGYPHSS